MNPDDITTLPDLAAALRHRRAKAGVTYREIVELVEDNGGEISRNGVATIMRGEVVPRPYYLAEILKALGVEDTEMDAWMRAQDRLWKGHCNTRRRADLQHLRGELLKVRETVEELINLLEGK